MPSEPKKPIEELLEASARKRRAEFGADPKMSNPMRARLQDEVAVLSRDVQPVRRSSWLGMSWPRLAMATALTALVIGGVGFWRQQHQAPVAGARLALEKTAPVEKDQLQSLAPAAPQSAAAAGSMTDSKLESTTMPLAKAEPVDKPVAENFHQLASPALATKARAAAQGRDDVVGNLKQQFSQATAKERSETAAQKKQATILDNFQVEQNGRDIRVVDDDGSTYTGQIERLSANDGRNVSREKRSYNAPAAQEVNADQAKAKEGETNNEFYFSARGFNSSLKKAVVFEGNYIAGETAARKDADVAEGKFEGQQGARIVGTAKVPGEPSVAIDAVAVPPK